METMESEHITRESNSLVLHRANLTVKTLHFSFPPCKGAFSLSQQHSTYNFYVKLGFKAAAL